jgi:hypothetical protein
VTFKEDTTAEEESPLYTSDKQEYMHWQYKMNHPAHAVLLRMVKQKMLPRRITKILDSMEKHITKLPMHNDCCGAKAIRRPWRTKETKDEGHIKKALISRDAVSVDQLESSIPGFVG